ncbi:MAG: anti-sigma factor [Candidatus Methylomirabilales bacterium]
MVSELKDRKPHVTGERLGAFVDGELEEAEADAVRLHLAACPACRTDAGLLGRAGVLLREAVAAEPAPDPEAVWRAVRARIQAEMPVGVPARRRFTPPAWLAWPRSLVWTAAALVLIAGLTLLQTREWVTPAPGPPSLPSPSLAAGPPTVVETLEGGGGATVMLYAPPESPVPVIWVFEGEPMEMPDGPRPPDAGTT